MPKLDQIEKDVMLLTKAEQEAMREWLENLLEDSLELKEEFRAEIETGKRDVVLGRYRVRKP